MKIDNTVQSKSSFLSLAKDTSIIMDRLLSNKKLLKLLYYGSRDWNEQPDLNGEQIHSLFDNEQISIVPKLVIDKEKLTYLRISFDDFTPNSSNDFYRDCIISFKIICHFSDWDLGNFETRPHRIAGEIDAMLDKTHLTGIGLLHFIGADQDIYDDEFGGVTLRYLAIHGNEDEVNPLV